LKKQPECKGIGKKVFLGYFPKYLLPPIKALDLILLLMFLKATVKDNDYNPQLVDKNTGGYMTMARELQFALM